MTSCSYWHYWIYYIAAIQIELNRIESHGKRLGCYTDNPYESNLNELLRLSFNCIESSESWECLLCLTFEFFRLLRNSLVSLFFWKFIS